MQGKIIKGIAGFYYVDVAESGIYECKAKGIFRKEKKIPLVGDNVEIEVLDEKEKTGNLIQILPRKNELIRPAAANVDQALVIFAVRQPDPNYQLLDRFLITMEQQEIPSIICFNKKDLAEQEELERMYQIYSSCGYQVLLTSAEQEEGISQIRRILEGKTTVVAGPSGVGKSSLTNLLQGEVSMETGEISKKLKRGRHTTRHAQLLTVGEHTYLMDTPGFSSLFVEGMEKEELRFHYPEFAEYEGACRFQGCVHVHEPDCAVKQAVEEENARWDASKPQIKVQIEGRGVRPAGAQPKDCAIVKAAFWAAELLGIEPEYRYESSTDANIPISMGIPAITVGRGGEEDGIHTLQEWYEPKEAWLGPQRDLLLMILLAGAEGVCEPAIEKR